ncbi:hypothetical protein [Paenibacillus aestuarii]|uniref:Uncharacterized protein n=1 Tax=Paenibacillus aestuarii TaxID=516965 RepID=A0ABW0KFE1_9BACL|nr:hypothetical protein [Paenibacillus aestuarii]
MKRPFKVVTASVGLLLASQLFIYPQTPAIAAGTPSLVEWSNDEVKAYYDAAVDWSLPIQAAEKDSSASPSPTPSAAVGGSTVTSSGTAPIIVNHSYGGGFGWDDLLLYHLIFNSGSPYSSSTWVSNHTTYNYRSNTPYVTKTYQGNSFSNRSVAKSPTTSSGKGTFSTNKSSASTTTGTSTKSTSSSSTSSSNSAKTSTGSSSSVSTGSSSSSSSGSSKSTSTSSGSIGGKSSGFSSSSSSSSGG